MSIVLSCHTKLGFDTISYFNDMYLLLQYRSARYYLIFYIYVFIITVWSHTVITLAIKTPQTASVDTTLISMLFSFLCSIQCCSVRDIHPRLTPYVWPQTFVTSGVNFCNLSMWYFQICVCINSILMNSIYIFFPTPKYINLNWQNLLTSYLHQLWTILYLTSGIKTCISSLSKQSIQAV